MKSLSDYILEAFKKFNLTQEWLEEMYDEFNEIYFNNELPDSRKIGLYIKPLKGKTLGQQGFETTWYFNRAHMGYGRYIMMYKNFDGRLEDVLDVVTDLKPYIQLSTKYEASQNQWEDTLIHEMIHLYTYKDGFAPKQAHGPEFRKKCDEIRRIAKVKYDKDYELEIYAKRNDDYSLTAEEQEKVIKRNQKKIAKAIGIYITCNDYKYPKRFLFVSKKNLYNVLKEIKKYTTDITGIYLSDNTYEKLCNKYGKFPVGRMYKYYNAEQFPDSQKYMQIGDNVLNEEDFGLFESILNEVKKKYIKPEMNIIEIPANINLSEINIEDIINQLSDNKDDIEIHGDKEIEAAQINGIK